MNLTSNSGMDFISMAKASGTNMDELIVSDEFIDWFKEYLSEKEINDALEVLERAKVQKFKQNQLNYLASYDLNKF